MLLFGAGWLPSASWGATLDPQLTTSRGCREAGDDPVFAVGETIIVSFRVGSSTVSAASVKLFDFLPDGRVGVASFGTIPTNQVLSFAARIGPPTGIEELVLRAAVANGASAQRACSFRVVAAPPAGTPTATRPTRTPTPIPPTRTRTATRTGAPRFSAEIRTDRGCNETGDHPIYRIGELVTLSFRIGSTSSSIAQATLADFLANGFVRVFSFGLLPTNATLQFRARIGPPVGVERLVLNARGPGGLSSAAACSFKVIGHGFGTPRPTRTATPPAPATMTPTVTP